MSPVPVRTLEAAFKSSPLVLVLGLSRYLPMFFPSIPSDCLRKMLVPLIPQQSCSFCFSSLVALPPCEFVSVGSSSGISLSASPPFSDHVHLLLMHTARTTLILPFVVVAHFELGPGKCTWEVGSPGVTWDGNKCEWNKAVMSRTPQVGTLKPDDYNL